MKRIIAALLAGAVMVSSSGCSTLTDVLSSAAAVREFSGSIDSQMDGTGELDGDMKELHGDYIVSERETEGTIDLVVTWDFEVTRGDIPLLVYADADGAETSLTSGEASGTASAEMEENGKIVLRGDDCDLHALIKITGPDGVENTEEQQAAIEKSNEFQKAISELVIKYTNKDMDDETYAERMQELEKGQLENILAGLDAVDITAEEREEILPVLETALENFVTVMDGTAASLREMADESAASLREMADESGTASDIAEFSGKLGGVFSGIWNLVETVGGSADDLHADEKAIKELEEKYSAKLPASYLSSLTYGER